MEAFNTKQRLEKTGLNSLLIYLKIAVNDCSAAK